MIKHYVCKGVYRYECTLKLCSLLHSIFFKLSQGNSRNISQFAVAHSVQGMPASTLQGSDMRTHRWLHQKDSDTFWVWLSWFCPWCIQKPVVSHSPPHVQLNNPMLDCGSLKTLELKWSSVKRSHTKGGRELRPQSRVNDGCGSSGLHSKNVGNVTISQFLELTAQAAYHCLISIYKYF